MTDFATYLDRTERDQLAAENARLDHIRADLQRENDGLKADNTSLRRANRELVAENCRLRQQAGDVQAHAQAEG